MLSVSLFSLLLSLPLSVCVHFPRVCDHALCRLPVPLSECKLILSLQSLCSPQNVNCRDLEGRHSTPLHFAAGYNRVAVVEYLLHHGADVHAKDKG